MGDESKFALDFDVGMYKRPDPGTPPKRSAVAKRRKASGVHIHGL